MSDRVLDKLTRTTSMRTNVETGDGNDATPAHGPYRPPDPRFKVIAAGQPEQSEIEGLMSEVPGSTSAGEDRGHKDARDDLVRELVEQVLDPRERFVVRAIIHEGMSVRELAEQLPWSKTHLHRVYQQSLLKLRSALGDDFLDLAS